MKESKNTRIHGEQTLAAQMLLIAPLIEKHFKPFSGQRAVIASGAYSAKLDKVVRTFRAECALVTKARIITSFQHSSAYIEVDIHEKPVSDPSACHVNYFKTTNYIGDIDSGTFQSVATGDFTFKFEMANFITQYKNILSVTDKQIETARAGVEELKAKIQKLENTVPYIFKELINPKR